MSMRTVIGVVISKDGPGDLTYHVFIDDENPEIPRFEIHPCQVIQVFDESCDADEDDLAWRAEVELIDGLIPYLKAYDVFDYDVSENGFAIGQRNSAYLGSACGTDGDGA